MSLEEQSFRNLIHFFKAEFKQVNEGVSPSKFFGKNSMLRLTKKKVWERRKVGKKNKLFLTDRALQVLEEC